MKTYLQTTFFRHLQLQNCITSIQVMCLSNLKTELHPGMRNCLSGNSAVLLQIIGHKNA